MPGQSGYYSWVCFIDEQRGAWDGPIDQSEIDEKERGYALDDNIKSWTEFTYYDERPTVQLTCNFNRGLFEKRLAIPQRTTFNSLTKGQSAQSDSSGSGTTSSRSIKFFAAPSREVALRPAVEEFRESSASHRYRITHHTLRVNDGGTNEWVYLHLRGPQGEFSRLLDRPHPYDDREQGQTDSYVTDGPAINPISQVGFRMVKDTTDTNFAWRCGSVEVEDLTSGYSVYIDDFGWVNRFDVVFWRTV
jgi:hypothetical protein